MSGVRDLIGLGSHLSEERLFECYLAERSGDGMAPPAADHLADCRPCSDAYTQLVNAMDEMWTLADEDTAEVFGADRLQLQQHEIARRLELLGHGARVLSFPSDGAGLHPPTFAAQPPSLLSRLTSRLVVGAAAAGLFIGVATGVALDRRVRPTVPAAPAAAVSAAPVSATANAAPAMAERLEPSAPVADDSDNDAVFLLELDRASRRPRTSELRALDAFTPRAREISYIIR